MYTGIFFDIDGTLRDVRTSTIPKSTMYSLRRLRESGYFLGISTGRAMSEIEDDIIGLIDWDAFICNNGQVLYTRDAGKIHEQFIPKDAIIACLEVSDQIGGPLDLVDDSNRAFLTGPANRYVAEAFRFFDMPIHPIRPYGDEKIITAMAFGPSECLYSQYQAIPGIRVIPGISTYADICLDNVSKYTGIVTVMERSGLNDFIAFGDSMNDWEMLKNANLSVAMGDSHPQIIDIATYHTDAVMEDGIEKACKLLQLY